MMDSTTLPDANGDSTWDLARHYRVRYLASDPKASDALMHFRDPDPRTARRQLHTDGPGAANTADDSAALELLAVELDQQAEPEMLSQASRWVQQDGAEAPLMIMLHGAHIFWRAGQAAILTTAERMPSVESAVVDFAFYEGELRRLEQEVRDAWPEVQADNALAFEATAADLAKSELVGKRMRAVFDRRARQARIASHLIQTDPQLPLLTQQIGDRLREKARVELRLEAVETQLEVQAQTYEMSSQRISDFRSSNQGHKLEWTIIVLLAFEAVLLLVDILWTLEV